METKQQRIKDTALIGSIMTLCAAPFGMAPLAIGLTAWYCYKEAKQYNNNNSNDQ